MLCELVPGGVAKKIIAAHAARLLESITPPDAVAAARCELAAALIEDLRRIDAQLREHEEQARHRGPGVRNQPDEPVRSRPATR